MKELLKALRDLAEVDNEINSLREIKEARPKQLDPIRARVLGRQEKVQRAKDEIRRLRVASDKADQDIRELEAKIQKAQLQLNTATSNEEFQVLREQKAKLEEEVGQKEESGLQVLSKSEQLAEELKRIDAEHQELEKELKAAEADVAREIAQIDQRLAELGASREARRQHVEAKYLDQYDRVLERHHDRALVSVENGVCQGCYMSVTPQMVNTLILGKEIVACKSCQRILCMME
jgi:uncharacterized protein